MVWGGGSSEPCSKDLRSYLEAEYTCVPGKCEVGWSEVKCGWSVEWVVDPGPKDLRSYLEAEYRHVYQVSVEW